MRWIVVLPISILVDKIHLLLAIAGCQAGTLQPVRQFGLAGFGFKHDRSARSAWTRSASASECFATYRVPDVIRG